MRIYFDTSALAKRYKPEEHSLFVDELFFTPEHEFYILSIISEVEMRATLRRFLSSNRLQMVWERFLSDLDKRFDVVSLDKNTKNHSYEVIKHSTCKTLDALHVAAALKLGTDIQFLTFDNQQAKAAKACGLRLLTPE